MIWLVLLFLVLGYFICAPRVIVHSHWHQRFDGLQFSSQNFYELLSEAIQERHIPEVRYSRVTRREGGLFSPRRECLRVTYRSYIHDICASPFGTGCYVSWWQVEERGIIQDILRKSPTIDTFLDTKPEYQIDAEKVFKQTVHEGILEVLDHITNAKGVRAFRI